MGEEVQCSLLVRSNGVLRTREQRHSTVETAVSFWKCGSHYTTRCAQETATGGAGSWATALRC